MIKRISTIPYYGGKYYMLDKIMEVVNGIHYTTFVDVFGGSAKVVLTVIANNTSHKGAVYVYNDIDSNLVNFFRVLRDTEKLKELIRLLELTPYSREEFYDCRKVIEQDDISDVERARCFFVLVVQSFGGKPGKGWGYNIKETNNGVSKMVSHNASIVSNLSSITELIQKSQIEHSDWKNIVKTYDSDSTLFYLDPPYLMNIRASDTKRYKHELPPEEHQKIFDTILDIHGSVMLSHYECEFYDRLVEHGFEKIVKSVVVSADNSKDNNGIRNRRIDAIYYRVTPSMNIGIKQQSLFK